MGRCAGMAKSCTRGSHDVTSSAADSGDARNRDEGPPSTPTESIVFARLGLSGWRGVEKLLGWESVTLDECKDLASMRPISGIDDNVETDAAEGGVRAEAMDP